MSANYSVQTTQPWIYTDQTGRTINGYRVFVWLPEFQESHELTLPTLDAAAIKSKAEELYKKRKEIAAL